MALGNVILNFSMLLDLPTIRTDMPARINKNVHMQINISEISEKSECVLSKMKEYQKTSALPWTQDAI